MNPRPITGDNDDDEKEEERKRKKKKEKERKREIGVYGEYGHDDHPANDFMDCIVFYKVCVFVSVLCFV